MSFLAKDAGKLDSGPTAGMQMEWSKPNMYVSIYGNMS